MDALPGRFVQRLGAQRLSESRESDPERARKLAELLYDQGLLMANLPLEDPTAYTDLVCELIG